MKNGERYIWKNKTYGAIVEITEGERYLAQCLIPNNTGWPIKEKNSLGFLYNDPGLEILKNQNKVEEIE